MEPVEGTPFDFRVAQPIGARIRVAHPQMLAGWGYDVNYCVGGESGRAPVHAARVVDPASGRRLDLSTTAPGMQFYTGNRLDGALVGPSGRTYRQSDGFCLEPHHYPDTPNKPGFPSCRLDPRGIWRSRTVYAFGVAD
jgi:aldose 1-epimerase